MIKEKLALELEVKKRNKLNGQETKLGVSL
jgi:hypothetical protein